MSIEQAREALVLNLDSAHKQFDAQLADIKHEIVDPDSLTGFSRLRFESATIARDIKIRRAHRRFELYSDRILSGVPFDTQFGHELMNLTA
jgi:hypothetical protein